MKAIRSLIIFVFVISVSEAQESPKIEYEQYTLKNGLRVVVHEDRKAPIVNVNVWYHVGSKDEDPEKTGKIKFHT